MLEERWLTYPYAELEKQRFKMCKKLIETVQALLEPPPESMPERIVQKPSRYEQEEPEKVTTREECEPKPMHTSKV